MSDLLTNPLWRAEDLGKPIPDSPHAVSVALPHWDHAIGYEEGDPAVHNAMQLGYPRFKLHPLIDEFFNRAHESFAKDGEAAYVFPSLRVAERCVDFVLQQTGVTCRIVPLGLEDYQVVLGPDDIAEHLKYYWQHAGEMISSRRAQALLEDRGDNDQGEAAKSILRERIAGLAGANPEEVYLFPTGMSALACAQRIFHRMSPNARTLQLGFPYVDLIKLQQKIGVGAHFFTRNDHRVIPDFESVLNKSPVAGVFTDLPGNPLLECAHVPDLYGLLKEKGIPLLIDETIGSFVNVDSLPHADMVMSSLTKYFSGISDVMAGVLILNRKSPLFQNMQDALLLEYEDLCWGEDMCLLEERSRDFTDRVIRINQTAVKVADYLRTHPCVKDLYYPKYNTPENYESVMKEGGGYGGLMSILLNDAKDHTPKFYDALRVCKGPSLGTNYTLACPYTILAHYDELEWVESQGVSRYLIRLSVGLESPEDLIERLEAAFSQC